jgi:predicted GNAT family acetyltransferase
MPRPKPKIVPLTADRWDDLIDLFGPERGACGGCWCMSPRVSRAEFNDMGKAQRKAAFGKLARTGPPPGLLAYEGDTAIGWVAIGPRASVARFNATNVSHAPEDDPLVIERVWAITCFYTQSTHRKSGLMAVLAKAALGHAKKNRALAVDVCPIEPDRPLTWGDGYQGIPSVFRALGFEEIARRSPRRPLMRKALA